MSISKEKSQAISRKMRKELEGNPMDEKRLDEIRLDEKCQYRIQFEPYSWCDLSDNICLEDSGNPDFDTMCENNTARESLEVE